jgi:hypothetical protein
VSGLGPSEVYRRIKPVDLAPVLAALPRFQWVFVNQGSTDVNKTPCHVVLNGKFEPEVMKLYDDLELGGRPGRLLIRKLAPRQGLAPHVDAWMGDEHNWRRFQIPFTSHPDIVMRWPDAGVELHLEPGWLYEVRFDILHEVVHGADVDRIHFQVDQVDATI